MTEKIEDLSITKMNIWFENSVYPRLPLYAARLCLILPLTGIFYSAEEMFPYIGKYAVFAIYIVFLLSALFCTFFYMMRKMYAQVRLFYLTDRGNRPPENCYTFSYTAKYLKCRLLAGYYRMLWNSLFFLPSFISFFILIYGIYEPGGMITGIFLTLSVLTAVLFISGSIFSFTVNGRYFLVDYLLYLNPLEPPDSIIRSSVLLTRGKLTKLAAKRLLLFTAKILFLIPPLSAAVRIKKAKICKQTYKS